MAVSIGTIILNYKPSPKLGWGHGPKMPSRGRCSHLGWAEGFCERGFVTRPRIVLGYGVKV